MARIKRHRMTMAEHRAAGKGLARLIEDLTAYINTVKGTVREKSNLFKALHKLTAARHRLENKMWEEHGDAGTIRTYFPDPLDTSAMYSILLDDSF